MRKFLPILLTLAFITLTGGQSWSSEKDDTFIGLGARFSWNNYKSTMLNYSGTSTEPDLSSTDFGRPHFGGEFQWGISKQLVLTATVDFGFFAHKVYPYPEFGSAGAQSVTATFMQVGAMLGAKYYFREPKENGVALYLSGGVGGYFAKAGNGNININTNNMKSEFFSDSNCEYSGVSTCDSNEEKLENESLSQLWDLSTKSGGQLEDMWQAARNADTAVEKELEMISDLASPLVAQVALGAEFFVTNNFSIGADIFGVRFSYASTNVGKVDGTNAGEAGSATWTGEQKHINLYIYSALTMNFNLTNTEVSSGKAAQEANWNNADGGTNKSTKEEKSDGWGGGWNNNGWSSGPAAPVAPAPAAKPKVAAPGAAAPSFGADEPPPPPAPEEASGAPKEAPAAPETTPPAPEPVPAPSAD